jgi:starch synthase
VKVALVTPELLSLVRRTNLAAVAESLAVSMHQAGAEVHVFLPHTMDVDHEVLAGLGPTGTVKVKDFEGPRTVQISSGDLSGFRVHLFEDELLFARRHPYGSSEGPYPDNWRRYAVFARAVLASLEPLGIEPDVLHCFDWTTGLLPLLHQIEYVDAGRDHPATRTGTWFAINNLAMQGTFEREVLAKIGIPLRWFRSVGGVELEGKVNFLKAGAEFATVIGTHSPSHAEKIQLRDRGYGLEEVFERRKKELVGISNGIDYSTWNPSNDPVLPANFSAKDKDPAGKRRCKAYLQELLRLDTGPRTPLAIHVGRWDADSGFDCAWWTASTRAWLTWRWPERTCCSCPLTTSPATRCSPWECATARSRSCTRGAVWRTSWYPPPRTPARAPVSTSSPTPRRDCSTAWSARSSCTRTRRTGKSS